MERKLELLIILFIVSLALLLANNFFGFVKMTGNAVGGASGTIELTIEVPPEIAAPAVVSAAGGGGGNLGGKEYVSVDPKQIKILLRDIDTFVQPIKIKNVYKNNLDLVFDSISIKDLVSFSEERIYLKPGETKIVNLVVQSDLNMLKGVYTGKILIISNDNIVKEIPTIIEVETTKKLFDLTITIPPEFRIIKAGDSLPVLVTIFDIANLGKSEVNLEYQIKDFNGNLLNSIKENLIIENQISFTKLIDVPEGLEPGDYIIDIVLRKGTTISTISQIFTVSEKPYQELPMSRTNLSIILLLIIAALVMVTIISLYEFKKLSKKIVYKRIKSRKR